MRDILTPIRARSSASRFVTPALALCTAAAAWLSQGTLAFTTAGGPRVALLPVSATAVLLAVAAGGGVVAARRAGGTLAPLWLLVLVALPWLPRALPDACLLWSGPLVLVVWLGIALGLLATIPGISASRIARAAPPALRARPALAAGVVAFVMYAIAAWQVSPSVPGGDEPHYLIITQSLLKDGDIRIENNHRAGDYRSYFAGDLSKPDYRRRGRNGEIYSIHAPGLPALVAPAFAMGGYHGVVLFLLLLAAAGSALAWRLAFVVTGRSDAAWFGWAAVTLSTSAIFHSFTVYPDGPGGVIVLTGVWALIRAGRDADRGDERALPWLLHGAALAVLPWIHTRFALIAGGFGALILLRLGTNRNAAGKAVAFLTFPAISAILWIGFFVAVYGAPDPSVPYANEEGSAAFIPGGLAGLFFDQRFGLLAYAPVLACAFAGLAAMCRERRSRRLGLELLFVLGPYLLAVTHFAMWWGGTSAPARFFVPMLPMLAIPAAAAWTAMGRRSTRAVGLGALAVTAFASAALVFVDGGRLAYNVRQGYALWLDWLSPATTLSRGVPAWWRGSEALLYRDIAVWAVAFAAAWGVLRAVEGTRPLRTRGALAAATAGAYAIAAMAAITVVWRLAGVTGATGAPAQLALLRRLGTEPRVLVLRLPSMQRVPSAEAAALLRIEPPASTTPGGAGPNDRPLYQVASVPAGRYRLEPRGAAPSGWLMIGIGRDQFSLVSGTLPAAGQPAPQGGAPSPAGPAQAIDLDFPIAVRAIVVRGDEQARRSVQGMSITPLSVVMPQDRLSGEVARRAVRYDAATVYFLDDRSFPEPEGFWVGGGRTSEVVLQAAEPGGRMQAAASGGTRLLIRNGPVQNHVALISGGWKVDATLAPGEERRVEVPMRQGRGAALLRISADAGFRPADVDPKSRDTRLLGLWVKPGR